MFLACRAQKENWMADDFSKFPNGNRRTFIINSSFKKSTFTVLSNIYLVSFRDSGLGADHWRWCKRTPFNQLVVDWECALCVTRRFQTQTGFGKGISSRKRCDDIISVKCH